jgi:hypothetical protein
MLAPPLTLSIAQLHLVLMFHFNQTTKMKKTKQLTIYILIATLLFSGCKKIDRFPETEFSDADFWNTENDLINAANRLYQELDGDWIDNRADDAVNQGGPNEISTGNRSIPNTSADWNDRYDEIFTANNIVEKAPRAKLLTRSRIVI